jgi:hypothetical protein
LSGIAILLTDAHGAKLELIFRFARASSLKAVGLPQALLVELGLLDILGVDFDRIIAAI